MFDFRSTVKYRTDKIIEDVSSRIKREIAINVFEKLQGLIFGFLLFITIALMSILFMLIGLFLIVFKAISDTNGQITYGSLGLGLLITFFVSLVLALIVRFFISLKINKLKKTLTK